MNTVRSIWIRWTSCILLANLFLLPATALATSPTVILPPDVLRDYSAFLRGRNPLTITNYSGSWSRRDVVEVVIFQQALALGGFGTRLELRPVPSYTRSILELRTGEAAAMANTLWHRDLVGMNTSIRISPALIREGEFEAGLYTSPENDKALKTTSQDDLRRLTGVCNRQWVPDWEIMSNLHLKQLIRTHSWKILVRMTVEKRADFLLAPFQPTSDMHLTAYGATLVPIPDLKVRLPGSRHFAISSSHPQSEEMYQALHRGITIMRDKGLITKAYTQCGFFNSKTKNWKVLKAAKPEASGK